MHLLALDRYSYVTTMGGFIRWTWTISWRVRGTHLGAGSGMAGCLHPRLPHWDSARLAATAAGSGGAISCFLTRYRSARPPPDRGPSNERLRSLPISSCSTGRHTKQCPWPPSPVGGTGAGLLPQPVAWQAATTRSSVPLFSGRSL